MTKRLRLVSLFLLLILLTALMTGCTKEFTCDWCDKTKESHTHSVSLYGEKLTVCDDCYEGIKSLTGN